MKCPKCNADNPDTVKFCGECGTQLSGIGDIEVTETMETPKEELNTGSTFAGRYQIIEELGKGGMGRVYKANDTKIKEKIALKLIKPEIAKDKKTIERFSNELKFARRIRHKNICQMFDLGEERGTHFITMEFIEGQDLKKLIRQSGQLAVGTIINIAKQMCDGLVEAHTSGVIHRDLKPNNIMIDADGNVRIMDFGIARSLRGKGITGAGVMIGTPEYMSPEQVEGKEVDQRSDIYSLGIILYEMVTGKVPFEGETPFVIGVKQKSEMPLNPKKLNTQIPDDFCRVILRSLEKQKENRYQNAVELRSELVKIEKGIPTTERVKPKKKPLTSREITVSFNFKKLSFLLVSLFVIAAGVYIIFLRPSSLFNPDRVIVAEFINQTGDSSLDPIGRRAAEMVSQGLKTIGSLEVASSAVINIGQDKKWDEKYFHRLAKDYKAAIVITGEYFQQGENLIFHSNIYHAAAKKMSPVPEPISDQRSNLSEALERLRNSMMSVVVCIRDPQMKTWFSVTTYVPRYEALIEFIRGMEFFFRGRFEECIECCDRAAEIDSQYVLPLFGAALANMNRYQYSISAQYLEKIKDIPKLSQGERYLRDWIEAHLNGDNESQFRIMSQQEKLAPGTGNSYQLGLEAIRTNRPLIAIESLSRLDPEGYEMKDWVGYWGVLVRAYHMMGNHRQELKAASKAQKQYPKAWAPLSFKIRALSAQGDFDKVTKVLKESEAKPLTTYWNPARLTATAGVEFKAHGYANEATEMFEQALYWLRKRNPDDLQTENMKYQLAYALIHTKNFDEALNILRNLCESNPEDLDYLGSFGIAAARKGDKEEALRISEEIKNWNKPYLFGNDLYWRAAIAASLEDKEQAVILLREAVSHGKDYDDLYCRSALEPLWNYPPFIEFLKPKE